MNLPLLPLGQMARDFPGATRILHQRMLNFCGHTKGLDANQIAADIHRLADPRDGLQNPATLSMGGASIG
ncbi:hypothetical protein [Marinobacter arenosus]|uniref:hypothetical protein n=1 Tax=Marinobacter arenosus TaxID=2856822 RepID=UPI001C4BB68C|nr:hypothetical protein [Marinobacter arenosus]MBW0147308.1 hypothetical protein [Marinobacter arenosus]